MHVNGAESVLVLAVVATWVATTRAERLRRARVDLRDAVQRAAELRAAIPALTARAAVAVAVAAALLAAAGQQ